MLEAIKIGFHTGIETMLFMVGLAPGAILTGILFALSIFLVFVGVTAVAKSMDD